MKLKNIEQHHNCECEIRYRQFKGKDVVTPGLFCSHHDVFLDWLNQNIADQLIDSGVPVTPYLDRKISKKNKQTQSKFYQRARKKQWQARKKLQKR